MPDNEDRKNNRELLRNLYMISQLGVTMVACLFIGFFLGRYLDDLLGTSPVMLIIFSLMGIGAAFRAIYQIVRKI